MAHEDRIMALTLGTQRRIGRLAERDHGLSLKAISLDSGIPYNTIRSYFGQSDGMAQAVLPVTALVKLIGVVPDYLLSQLLDPAHKRIADQNDGDDDHDTLAANCIDFASRTAAARHPDGPGGVEITEDEDRELRQSRQRLRA
jgi:hypothetical protein